jgi:hypothetical protein
MCDSMTSGLIYKAHISTQLNSKCRVDNTSYSLINIHNSWTNCQMSVVWSRIMASGYFEGTNDKQPDWISALFPWILQFTLFIDELQCSLSVRFFISGMNDFEYINGLWKGFSKPWPMTVYKPIILETEP